jgi:hypothetical protein
MRIPIDCILQNPQQPRGKIDEAELQSLADSIKEVGLINPIAVEKSGEKYILIDGERRWRACKLAGLTEIDASMRPSTYSSSGYPRLFIPMEDIFTGEVFTAKAAGKAMYGITLYNQNTNTYSAFEAGFNGAMHAIAIAPNEDVYIGGEFTNVRGGLPAKRLLKAAWGAVKRLLKRLAEKVCKVCPVVILLKKLGERER